MDALGGMESDVAHAHDASALLTCLVANGVATVVVTLVVDFVLRRQRRAEEGAAYNTLCQRVQAERDGWDAERRYLLAQIAELKASVTGDQRRLTTQYLRSVMDSQRYIDTRVDDLRSALELAAGEAPEGASSTA